MIIYVYAICKNESAHVATWMASMRESDGVYVLDTGSEDDTAERLTAAGAIVTRESVSPWRFDAARNRSLDLVPEDADLCVCTDLDECFHPGWRAALERAWRPGITRMRYRYTWSFRPDGSEGTVFWSDKVHTRHGYRWHAPVHEFLQRLPGCGPEYLVDAEGVQLDHHPDPSKSRGQYLPLLEQWAAEAPEDSRAMHYLGREYLYYGRWTDCIDTLERHLALPSSLWVEERCASMRYLARAWQGLGDSEAALRWFWRAIGEAPHLREPYVELAQMLYQREKWDGVVYLTRRALSISLPPRSYLCEETAWGSLPWDLLCLGLFHTGRTTEALDAAEHALALSPNDPRLTDNVALLRTMAASR